MKRIKGILLFAVIMMAPGFGYAQSVAAPYEVGTWSGFRSAAICYTFDDEYPNQISIAMPAFDKYDFKMTMFNITTSSWPDPVNWTDANTAVLHGHEIASHTVTHPHIYGLSAANQNTEFSNSKNTIESHITGYKCLTMAYPYCEQGTDTVTRKYYIAARGCSGSIEPSTPSNYMNISSMVCGTLGINTIETFKSRFATAASTKGWCVFLIHGIAPETSYSPLDSTLLKNSLYFLSYRKSKFWVTTFRDAALYSKERNAANVIDSIDNDTLKIIRVTDALSDSIYNFPLTIRRPLPVDWPSATVTQNAAAVPARIVQINTTVYLTFDVVPDGGYVNIIKNNDTIIPTIDTIPPDSIPSFTSIKNFEEKNHAFKAWVVNNNLNFSLPTSSGTNLVIVLYDMTGRKILTDKATRGTDGKGNIRLPNTLLRPTGYIVNVNDGISTWSKQIVIM
jgi:hypothetical protein